jgi:hypothetical protein
VVIDLFFTDRLLRGDVSLFATADPGRGGDDPFYV